VGQIGGVELGAQQICRPASLALGVVTGYLHPSPGNQVVHPFQKKLAPGFAFLVLALGSVEGDLIHGGNGSYAVACRQYWSVAFGTYPLA